MKPCALLRRDFLISAGNKIYESIRYSLVRNSSFSKAQQFHNTGPWCILSLTKMTKCACIVLTQFRDNLNATLTSELFLSANRTTKCIHFLPSCVN